MTKAHQAERDEATTSFDDVFAVPGQHTIIDVVREDGRSGILGETLEEVRLRYPQAARVRWIDWQAEQAAKQNTPVAWMPCTAQKYHDMLEILPPAYWDSYGFLVGEPCDHSYSTGQPRYQAFIEKGSHDYKQYFASSRPVTITEFKALTRG